MAGEQGFLNRELLKTRHPGAGRDPVLRNSLILRWAGFRPGATLVVVRRKDEILKLLLMRRLNMLNRRPRAGGDPVTLQRTPLDSRLRGNDVI